ncbi:hypothetical protein DRO91_01755 [Candidatus Heimdallarchaeota archaeon]|nr:MAG: hypothetical protein DRP02_04330 [Candidatus Gerdarchaeota archaeon]RLI73940.1 MAG: hypothetical protein DRO91_01755 [Candidatus Heimdallarchaeota archaeon]
MPTYKSTEPMNASNEIESESDPRVARDFQLFIHKTFSKSIQRLREKDWKEFSFETAIVLVLISCALFVRLILAYDYRVKYGLNIGSDIIWNHWLPFNINDIEFRGFADFNYYYFSWIKGWYENNWYPYEWADPINVYDYYSYPPVFLYFLIFLWRPGMNNLWMAFPMIFTDAAVAGVVYLILREINKTKTSRVVAVFGGVLMAIAPINVIYDGIYWLNPGPVTLLTIIAFYFAMKKKWWQAFFWLAIATMTKQNALFFAYPLFMAMVGEKVRNKTIRETVIESIMNAMLFVGVGLLLSIPYIFIDPVEYGRHMLFPGRKLELRFTAVHPATNDCVSFAKSLEELGFPQVFVGIAAFGNYSMLWMIASASVIAVGMLWRSYQDKMDNIEFFEWIAMYTIVTHIFMPRGVYKFYTAYYVPMILVALLGTFTYFFSSEKWVAFSLLAGGALFLWFNFWLLIMDRWAVPFYLFMVALTIGLLAFVRNDVKAFITRKRKKRGERIQVV